MSVCGTQLAVHSQPSAGPVTLPPAPAPRTAEALTTANGAPWELGHVAWGRAADVGPARPCVLRTLSQQLRPPLRPPTKVFLA